MKRFIFLLFLIPAMSSMAATYYVNSSTGNDSAAGSSGAPWKTLTTSISKLASGDTLNCVGSWSITTQFSWSTANMTILGGGAATVDLKPVSTGGTLVFNGNNTTFRGFTILDTAAPTVAVQVLIQINGNNCLFADCLIRDLPVQNIDDEIMFQLNGNGCTFTNLTFNNNSDHDLFRAWGTFNKWISCTYSNCQQVSSNPHADCIQTWWTGQNVWSNVIERCYYVNCSQALFQLKGTPDNVTCYPGQEGYWTIRNCIINNCPSWPIISTDNFRFYNNLIYHSGAGTGPTLLISGPCLNHGKYYNNVHVNCTSLMNGSTLGANSTDANNAFTASGLSWGGTGDFVTTEAACKFANAAASNFRLQAGSSLIGKGVNLTTDKSMTSIDADGNARPSTGAWDIGPFQYSAGGTPTKPSPPTNLRQVNGI